MPKLHAILAAEKGVTNQAESILAETTKKFKNKNEYYLGYTRTLQMFAEGDAARAAEAAAFEHKEVVTNVHDTLEYALGVWANAENLQFDKNLGNQRAQATIEFTYTNERGQEDTLRIPDVPIDELMGLEKRLTKIRELFKEIPTLDASKQWQPAEGASRFVMEQKHPTITVKNIKVPKVLTKSAASEKHPAQTEVYYVEEPEGKVIQTWRSGAVTAIRKAEMIDRVDGLISAIRQVRSKANEVEIEITSDDADLIRDFLLAPLKN